MLYPRLAAIVAGAIAFPAFFGLLFLPSVESWVPDHWLFGITALLIFLGGPVALGMWSRPLSYAAGVGAVTLFLAMWGYGCETSEFGR